MSACLRSLALLAAFLPATSLSAQEPKREHLLRMTIPSGSVQFHRKTVMVERTGADAIVRTITMEITLETRVTVAEGKTSVEQTVRRIVSKATGPRAHSYDSETGGDDPRFGSMVGKSIRMKMDERGGTSEVQLPEGLPQERCDPWFIQALQFPEAPVGIGKTWEVNSAMVIPEVSVTSGVLVHKLATVDKGKATIETQARVDKDQLPAGMILEKNGATSVIELATGKLLESRSELVWSVSKGEGKKAVTTMTTTVQPIEPPPAKQAGTPPGGKL